MLKKVADSYEKRRVGRVEPRVRKRRSFSLLINARTPCSSSGKNEIGLKSFADQRCSRTSGGETARLSRCISPPPARFLTQAKGYPIVEDL